MQSPPYCMLLLVTLTLVKGQQYIIRRNRQKLGCTLGTPALISDGKTVNLSLTDIRRSNKVIQGFKMQVGYTEIFKKFKFKGCTNKADRISSERMSTKDIGRCYHLCQSNSQYFGIGETGCYCNISVVSLCDGCDADCKCNMLQRRGFCEPRNYSLAAVYTTGSSGVPKYKQNQTGPCWTLVKRNGKATCSMPKHKSIYICPLENDVNGQMEDKASIWNTSMSECLQEGFFEDDQETITRLANNSKYWTGEVTHKIVTTYTNAPNRSKLSPLGYIIYTSDHFELKFSAGNEDQMEHVLCVVSDKDDQRNHHSKSLGHPDSDSKHLHSLVAVYIVVPLVVVIVVVLIVVLIFMKKMSRKLLEIKSDTVQSKVTHSTEVTKTNSPTFEEENDTNLLQSDSEYMTINDIDMDTEDPYDETEDIPIKTQHVYNKAHIDNGAYDLMNANAEHKTRSYNTFDEEIPSSAELYNKLNEKPTLKVLYIKTYDKLDSRTDKPLNETTTNTETYELLNDTTTSKKETYETLNKDSIEPCDTLTDIKYNPTTETPTEVLDASQTGNYFILEKQSHKGELCDLPTNVHNPITNASLELSDAPQTGNYFILEKQSHTKEVYDLPNYVHNPNTNTSLEVSDASQTENYFILEK